jgi:hypothetical protein
VLFCGHRIFRAKEYAALAKQAALGAEALKGGNNRGIFYRLWGNRKSKYAALGCKF